MTSHAPQGHVSPLAQRSVRCASLAGVSLLALTALLSACASTPKQVESVARSDLGCDQVSIAEIADNRYAASGCGRGGVYAQLCGNGEACSWVRLRGADNTQGSAGGAVPMGPVREVIPAPPPEQRQVIQAPPPAQRDIIPAPPPPAPQPGSSAPTAPDASGSAPTSSSAAPTDPATQQAYSAQQVPLESGDLSQPFQAQVPLAPTAQQVQYPPPAPLVEQRPPPPQSSYQWVDGYWSWNSNNWLWAPGYWTPPMYGYNYVPGSWYWSNNYWWYGPGGWARPRSTYISYGVRGRPYGYAYTRSFTPRVTTAYPGRIGAHPAQQAFGHAPSARAFTPSSSPVYRYPSSTSSPLQAGPSRMGASSHGGPSSYGSHYNSSTMQPSFGSPTRFGSGPSHSEFRGGSMGRGSMPSAPSFSPSRAPSMGRMGGGGFGGGHGGGGHMGGGGRMGAGPSRR
ncbi:MAG: putative signal peptide protein [Myxococcaceae bacterium]|nr:putative signal peptide protein [Myxococcaceae bacterium]